MLKIAIAIAAVLLLWTSCDVQAQSPLATVNLRFSEQISNGPAGSCGCFGMEGFAADTGWRLKALSLGKNAGVGAAVDLGVVHTGSVDNAPYGLTLTTVTGGPRLNLPGHRLQTFAQALFGFAHGSGSAFPQGNNLVDSANSFALDVGGGADYILQNRFALRVLQLDYLRTDLPNGNTDWQNSLRISAGVTIRFRGTAKY
jgi:outer membrane immunogenic protein